MRRFVDKLSAFYDRRGAVCLGAAALILMALVLFGGRTIGLSNNGDFKRVMDASSLQFDADDGAFAFDSTYIISLTERSAAGNILKILSAPKAGKTIRPFRFRSSAYRSY